MLKKHLFLATAILMLCQQHSVSAMSTGAKIANGFRMSAKVLSIGSMFALGAVAIKNYHNKTEPLLWQEKTRDQVASQQFVLDTIHELYPELKDRNIVVLAGLSYEDAKDAFGALHHNNVDYILVPFKDIDLREAQHADQFDTLGGTFDEMDIAAEGRYSIDTFKKGLQELADARGVSIKKVIAVKEYNSALILPRTLKVWKAFIGHEASHILNRDSKRYPYSHVLTPAALTLGEFALGNLLNKTPIKRIKSPVISNILKGCGHIAAMPLKVLCYPLMAPHATLLIKYWQEYRADRDAMERIKDPQILRAISAHLSADSNDDTAKSFTFANALKSILDPHPSNETRARRFADAAQKLVDAQADGSAIKN